MLELCKDVFGNYVVQKLFEFGSDNMRGKLAGILCGGELEMSNYGCRVVSILAGERGRRNGQ